MRENRVLTRSLRFWGRQGTKMALAGVSAALLYGVFFGLMPGGYGEKLLWDVVLLYEVIMGMGMLVALGCTGISALLPRVLSFGSGRREALWGLQFSYGIYLLWMLAQTALLAYVAVKAAPGESEVDLLLGRLEPAWGKTLLGLLGGCLILTGLSQIGGVLLLQTRVRGAALFWVVFAWVIFTAEVILGVGLVGFLAKGGAVWILPAAGAAVYLASLILTERTVDRCEVRI